MTAGCPGTSPLVRRGFSVVLVLTLLWALVVVGTIPANAGISYEKKLHDDETFAELGKPWGVTTDTLGNIYVADTSNHRIVKFDGLTHDPVVAFGRGGPDDHTDPGFLYYPEAVTFANNLIYVADTANAAVQVYTTAGVFQRKWETGVGAGDGQLIAPRGIAADCQGNIYVADGRRGDVQKFDANGRFLDKFGSMAVPAGIAISANFETGQCTNVTGIYVTDEHAGRIVRFDLDGGFIQFIGTPGSGELQFQSPDEIAVEYTESAVSLWVAEAGSFRVQKITSTDVGQTWQFALQFAGGENALASPHGIALDQQGNVVVTNTDWNDVYVYKDLAPELDLKGFASISRAVRTEGLTFRLKYNQVDKTCDVTVKATVIVPLANRQEFTVRAVASHVGSITPVEVKADLSSKQAGWIGDARKKDKAVPVVAKATAACSDEVVLTKTQRYKLN